MSQYRYEHLIKTSVVLHPVHDDSIVSDWKVCGQRASITFEDNGQRAARGMTHHADIKAEFPVPHTGRELRAMLLERIESTLKIRSECRREREVC